jgi:hypothetical protein
MPRLPLLTALPFAVLLAGCGPSRTPRDVEPENKEPTASITSSDGRKKPDDRPARPGGDTLPPKKVAPEPNPLVKPDAEAGVVRGEVRWKGPMPPAPAAASGHTVSVNGKPHKVTLPAAVRIDPSTAGVADVVICLAKPPTAAAPPAPVTADLLQSRGAFSPHVQVVPRDSLLRLRTADDEADFHASGGLRFTRHLRRGESAPVPLPRTGLVTVRSDDRPWMVSAYVRVLDHAFYAVTGADGRFELPRLPAGDYELILWHPGEEKPFEARVPLRLDARHGATLRWTLPASRN